jgi:diguanylate cyclase (GGDEF)-like protein/PAS domain S-box-containing protein
VHPDLSAPDRDVELERGYSIARIVGAVLALVLAPFMGGIWYPGVLALAAYLGACSFGLSYAWRRAVAEEARLRLRWAGIALDIGAVIIALAVLANDPSWTALLVVPLLVFVSTMRAGTRGGIAAAATLSVIDVVGTLLRHQAYGFPIEPVFLTFQLGLFWLAVVVFAMVMRETVTLQTLRSDLLAPLLMAQEQVGDAVLIRDGERFIFVGDAMERITGHAPDEFAKLGNILDLVPADERAAVEERLALEGPDRFETHLVHRDGRHVPVEVVRTRVSRGGGTRVVAIVRDITDRRAIAESLEFSATHDQLTGLPNRVVIARAMDAVKEERVALLLVDLAHFGDVSERFGHAASDELLRHAAVRIREHLRSLDTLGHVGADDFAIVLPGADAVAATRMARDLEAAFAEPFDIVGRPLLTRANFGIAVRPDHGRDALTLLRCSEVAVGHAAATGGGIAVYDAARDAERAERMTLLAELQDVIGRNALSIAFQPSVDVRTGAPVALEALARWVHPTRGAIPPSTFIPLAEYSGLITSVTRQMLRGAIDACRSWHEAGEQLAVAVNVSLRDLGDPEFPTLVREMLGGLDPRFLVLEITESLVIADREHVMRTLAQLRDMGVRLALDDFGSGLSSLTQLHELPVAQVKLDRVFAQRLSASGGDSVARAAIELAHALGLEAVAEGVEDAATLSRLGELSCDLAQGYLLATPMPPEEVLDWVRAQRRRAIRAVTA